MLLEVFSYVGILHPALMALGRQMVMVGQGSPHAAPAPQAPSLTGGSGAVGGGTGDGREARERLAAKEERGRLAANQDGCQQSHTVSLLYQGIAAKAGDCSLKCVWCRSVLFMPYKM